MCRREQQPDDPTRGFADPMDPRQRMAIEHSQDLCADLFRSVGIAWARNVGLAAPKKIGAIDATALGDRRDPAVPECRIASEAVHHQHGGRRLTWPQVIVERAVERKTFVERNRRHRKCSISYASEDTSAAFT